MQESEEELLESKRENKIRMNLNKKYIEQRKQHDDQKGRERQLKTKERKTVSSQSEWI